MERSNWRYGKIGMFLFLLFLLSSIPVYGKSVTREGEPIVKLVDFQAPEKVMQGELFTIYADMSLSKSIQDNRSIFFHIKNPRDEKIVINADFDPDPPVSSWLPGEIVGMGPVCLYVPEEVPPGEYNIAMGMVSAKTNSEGSYIREPYANPEIKNFVVGKITFEKAIIKEERREEKELYISNFSDEIDINKWETRNATIELTGIAPPVGKVIFSAHSLYPAIMLERFFGRAEPKFTDWSHYDYLELEVYQAPDKKGSTAFSSDIFLQIKDSLGNKQKIVVDNPPPKGTPVKVPLAKFAKGVDLTRVSNFTFFSWSFPKDYTFYISYVKLTTSKEYVGKGPFVKLEGVELSKEKLHPGENFTALFNFSITRKFFYEHSLFIHLFDPNNEVNTYLNADVKPRIPTTDWGIGKVIKEGPYTIHIPVNTPPGDYVIEAGLSYAYEPPPGSVYAKYYRGKDGVFYMQQPTFPVDYVKQQYINYKEYGDWIVGSFRVLPKDE